MISPPLWDWVIICAIGLIWIEHYMDWKLRIAKEATR